MHSVIPDGGMAEGLQDVVVSGQGWENPGDLRK